MKCLNPDEADLLIDLSRALDELDIHGPNDTQLQRIEDLRARLEQAGIPRDQQPE